MPSQDVITQLDILYTELRKLEPAIKHVEMAQQVTSMVQEIPQQYVKLLDDIKAIDQGYKQSLMDLLTDEIATITGETVRIQKYTKQVQEKIRQQQEDISKICDTVKAFHERVAKINFPERLDRLDANVAGIMAAVQAIQSRLDMFERNMIDRIQDGFNRQSEKLAAMEATAKRQQTFLYVIILLGIVSCGIAVKLMVK